MSDEIFNVDLIREKIESYYSQGNRLVITLKDSPLRKIEIFSTNSGDLQFSGLLDLSDLPELWTKILAQSLKNNAFNMSKIFIELLGLVSTLKWTGFISKKPIFISNPALHNMRKQFPSLKIKNDLAVALLHNSLLIEKLRSVKPDTIAVHLAFIPRVLKSESDLRHARFEYIKDPNEIIWKINIGFHLNEPFKSRFNRSTASDLIDVMNLIAEDVLDISNRQVMTPI
jgi:hypothetical protein